MWNRFTHNILTIDSHVRRLAQMRPRVAQKTFGHKLPSNLIPMSHWAGDVFLLTFPDAANIQAAQVDLIRVSENNCSCSENLPKYLSQPLWLLLSAICLPIANGCQSAQLYHWNLWPFHCLVVSFWHAAHMSLYAKCASYNMFDFQFELIDIAGWWKKSISWTSPVFSLVAPWIIRLWDIDV